MGSHRHLGVIWLFCFEQYFKAKYDDERNNMITGFTEVKTFADILFMLIKDFLEFSDFILKTKNSKMINTSHEMILNYRRSVFALFFNGGDENVMVKKLNDYCLVQTFENYVLIKNT